LRRVEGNSAIAFFSAGLGCWPPCVSANRAIVLRWRSASLSWRRSGMRMASLKLPTFV